MLPAWLLSSLPAPNRNTSANGQPPHPPQVWASYSPVKNSAADARAKAAEHAPTHSATSAEFDMYKCASLTLKTVAGVDIPAPGAAVFNGVPVETYPRIVLSPGFAPTLADAKAKVRRDAAARWSR